MQKMTKKTNCTEIKLSYHIYQITIKEQIYDIVVSTSLKHFITQFSDKSNKCQNLEYEHIQYFKIYVAVLM